MTEASPGVQPGSRLKLHLRDRPAKLEFRTSKTRYPFERKLIKVNKQTREEPLQICFLFFLIHFQNEISKEERQSPKRRIQTIYQSQRVIFKFKYSIDKLITSLILIDIILCIRIFHRWKRFSFTLKDIEGRRERERSRGESGGMFGRGWMA